MIILHDGPAIGMKVITPNDSNIFDPTRAILLGTTGNLNVVMFDGSTGIIQNVPAGLYPLSVVKVLATSTTATGIVGFY